MPSHYHCGSQLSRRFSQIHFLTRDRVEALYPRYDDFQRLRREYDPNDIPRLLEPVLSETRAAWPSCSLKKLATQ